MRSDERDALLEEYARSQFVGEWCIYIAIPWALLRRVGVDPLSRRGRLLTGLMTFGWLFVSAIVVALATGTMHESPLLAWLTVAAIEGVGEAWGTAAITANLEEANALLGALTDPEALNSILARQRRWGLPKILTVIAAFGLLFAAVIFLPSLGDWSKVAPGSIWLLVVVLYWAGESVWTTAWYVNEMREFARQRLQLPADRPIDSPVVKLFLRGTYRMARTGATIAMLYLVYVLLLLPRDVSLILPFAAVILGVCYGSIIAEIVSGRWLVAHIVGEEKSRRLTDLGNQIDALIARGPDLSPEDERKLDLLRKAHEAVRESPLTSAPLTAVGRIFGTALVPTLAFVALAATEGYVERVANRILDWLGS
jgi:hypothetical protein